MIKIKNIILLATLLLVWSCASQRSIDEEAKIIRTSPDNRVRNLEIQFAAGEAFNHPSFAFWTEDLYGNYVETLFVTEYVAKGKFKYGEIEPGKWKNEPGEVRRPATLPYWSHKRNIQAPDGLYIPSPETPVADALTAATPKGNFILQTATSNTGNKKFRVLCEINQAWDSNEFWTNNKFPDEMDYLGSLQPALVYAVTVDPQQPEKEYFLNPIGHSHPSGKNGELFTDITTLTTAKEIAHKIVVRLK